MSTLSKLTLTAAVKPHYHLSRGTKRAVVPPNDF